MKKKGVRCLIYDPPTAKDSFSQPTSCAYPHKLLYVKPNKMTISYVSVASYIMAESISLPTSLPLITDKLQTNKIC